MSKETLDFVPPLPPKNYKISSAFSYNFKLALTGTTAYINIIIRDGKNIVGYAVVNIYTNDLENAPAQSYYAKLLKSVSFPKVDGKYQKITSEYV